MKHSTDVDTNNLGAKKYCIALKAVVRKLDINKLVNIRLDYLDVKKLKTEKHITTPDICNMIYFNMLIF